MKKRADGRYCKQILLGYLPNGKRKMKTIYGKTKKEVEKKELEIRIEIDKGIYVENNNTKVGIWADEWLKTYKIGVEYNTFKRYKATIENQIKPILGNCRLTDVKLNMLQKIMNDLSLKYSTSTLNKFKITLNQLYKFAIKLNMAYVNPCDGLIIPKKTQNKKKIIPDEIIYFLNLFCKNYKNGDFIMTLLYTGLRRGEIAALTWKDIDLQNNCIFVNKSIEFVNNQPRIKTPKTENGTRIIPILNILKPFLVRPINANDNDCVFKNKLGNMHTAISLRRLFENFNKQFNIFLQKHYNDYTEINITMHQFRHTFATILYKSNVDIKTAQSYLGHSSVNVTLDIYTHLDKQFKMRNAENINNYLNQSSVSQKLVKC